MSDLQIRMQIIVRCLAVICLVTTPIKSLAAIKGGFGVAKSVGESGTEGDEPFDGIIQVLEFSYDDNIVSPEETGWSTSAGISYSQDPSSNGLSLSFDQGFGAGFATGLSVGHSRGESQGSEGKKFSQSRLQLRGSQWFRESTLRVGLEISHQQTSRDSVLYQDTDAEFINTPGRLSGKTFGVKLTHLTTPTTIVLGDVGYLLSGGRPAAVNLGVEGRQYIGVMRAAIHGGLSHYRDLGSTTISTDYGQVTAYTLTLRYYQRLPLNFIGSLFLRTHKETEIPRSLESDPFDRATQSETLGMRWRYTQGSWTEDASDVGIFYGRFRRSEGQGENIVEGTIQTYGISGKLVFD